MAEDISPDCDLITIDRRLDAFETAGLIQRIGGSDASVFEVHPLLTTYLRAIRQISDDYTLAFTKAFSKFANAFRSLTPAETHFLVTLNRSNLYRAREYAMRSEMTGQYYLFTDTLALDAQHVRLFDLARNLFLELLVFAAPRLDSLAEARAVRRLGSVAEDQRNFNQAISYYQAALLLQRHHNYLDEVEITLQGLGRVSTETRDWKAAESWLGELLPMKQARRDQHGEGILVHQLGIIAEGQRNFLKAAELYERSLGLMREAGDSYGEGVCYHHLGKVARAEGRFGDARRAFLNSLAIKQRDEDAFGVSLTCQELGSLELDENRLNEASKWFLRSLAIQEAGRDLSGASVTYHQLGIVTQLQGNLEVAKRWLWKALSITTGTEPIKAAYSYGQLGIISALEGDIPSCTRYVIQAIEDFRRNNVEYKAEHNTAILLNIYRQVAPSDQDMIRRAWAKASLGPFPVADEDS